MAQRLYPNESGEYREARDRLLKEEQALVDKVKAIAAMRRNLPRGGEVKEYYVFQWASGEKLGKAVKLSELFGDKDTLLIYSFMYGPNWDKPCLSCTSLMDGFDRAWQPVTRDAAFVAIAKAQPEHIDDWAKYRGWSQLPLVSGYKSTFQADYRCQVDGDDDQRGKLMVFRRQDEKTFHFWENELDSNFLDTVWPYWNLMDFTPEGRPDRPVPPLDFQSKTAERYMSASDRTALARAR
jgi:predicted dithiol-disulfide oxidoreductase (DUF899 family)